MHTASRVLALVTGTLLIAAGCAGGDDSVGGAGNDRLTIVTDIYPTTFAVQQVVGDDVEVIQLTPPGVEPHDYELSPSQVTQIVDADLVAYVPGIIPAVEESVLQEVPDRAVDVTEGITRLVGTTAGGGQGGGDPHVWLDPSNVAVMGANVASALTARGHPADAAGLRSDMAALDKEISTALGHCAITPMVVSHEAFGYLAAAYGFEQVALSGLSPEAEPSPRKMSEITQLVADTGVTTIYFESLASPAAAQAIAAETGAATALLDPIEGNTDDRGYDAIMRANAATLQQGQSCS